MLAGTLRLKVLNGGSSRGSTPMRCAPTAMWCCWLLVVALSASRAATLADIRSRGELRHIGLPYARFVTGSGDGLEVDLIKAFAHHLGVRYTFVATSRQDLLSDLVGRPADGAAAGTEPPQEPRGDLAAAGLTITPERQAVIAFSTPVFPTEVWLLTRGDSPLQPIAPSGTTAADIEAVLTQIHGLRILGIPNSTLWPEAVGLAPPRVVPVTFMGNLNDMVPALIRGDADATLIDLAIAGGILQRYAGRVKVIGPVSAPQGIGVAFAPASSELRLAFDAFFRRCRETGAYVTMVRTYYPGVLMMRPAFFVSPPTREPTP